MYQKYSQTKDTNGIPILLTVLAPKYPDIILEFIVDYYIDKEYWIIFAQEVREYENVWFNGFLIKGMKDFPDTESFLEMYFAPLQDPRDTFGFTVNALTYVREFADHGKLSEIIDTLGNAGMPSEFGLFEMELWRRIIVAYSERKEYENLYSTGVKFIKYIKERKQIISIIEHTPEIVEGFCIELLNAKQFNLVSKLLIPFTEIAYDEYIRADCSKAYYKLINYQLHYKVHENIITNLKDMLAFLRKHPKDDNIIKYFVDATDEIYQIFIHDYNASLLINLVPIIEQAYDCSKNEKIAEILAILEASRFSIAIMTNNNRLARKSQKRINNLFQAYKNNEDVILSYASVTASMYIEEPKHISEKEIIQFKSWKDTYPERVGILEAYGKILLAKWLHMTNSFDKKNAKSVFKEVENIAKILSEQHETPELLLTTLQIREMGFYLGFYES